MDGSFGELLFLLIKFGFLLVSIIGIVRLFKLRSDKKKHITTKVFTIGTLIITIYLFVGNYIEKKRDLIELSGKYRVEYFMCEKCHNCIAELKGDGTYKLTQNNIVLDTGEWDFTKPFVTTFLIFNNGNEKEIKSNKTISNIKNGNCKEN
ncbi:hypothetical protein [Thalassobellus sediminis]|uniref:hypothetical protein n=1 Tax=Thalassobellus sediminis TaxID=3367753 RepID=UPI00379BD4D5